MLGANEESGSCFPFQLIGKKKLRRLADLAKQATITICVDDKNNIQEIDEVCGEVGCRIGLVVEVNVGQDRSDLSPSRHERQKHRAKNLPRPRCSLPIHPNAL